MLEDLMRTIEKLKARIRDYPAIGDNEIRTRATLIDPLLAALGWDVSDPGLVEIEPKVERGRADYALLESDGTPSVFVEAKSLNTMAQRTDGDPAVLQVVNYVTRYNFARSTKCKYCAWTNGDVWQVFDVPAQESVLQTSIRNDQPAKCALKLLGLWRPSMRDGGYDAAVEPVMLRGRKAEHKSSTPPSPKLDRSRRRTRNQISIADDAWVPLDEYAQEKKPLAMRFSDGKVIDLRFWNDLVPGIARWLYDKGLLTDANGAVRWSKTLDLLNSTGMHPNGKRFRAEKKVDGTPFRVFTNMSGASHLKGAKMLLEHCGQHAPQVHLQPPVEPDGSASR